MASAYASLLSLTHTINHLNIHPRPPISLHHQQLHSLTQNLTFLQNYLEQHSNEEGDDVLESRIAGVAYAAEDLIESHIVDRIHGENMSSVDLSLGLEKVIQDMDLIRNEAMQIIPERIQPRIISPDSTASTSQSSNKAVFGRVLVNEVLDKLTGGRSNLQIFAIVGMGGIGKTTLATNIYSHSLIVQHFDIVAWVTISQVYSRREILLQVLMNFGNNDLSQKSEDELGIMLHQHLFGRRYLIVMDDIWNIDAWDGVKSFFPDNNNGSRIMVTTRLSNLAFELSGCHGFQMQFLDEDKSWDLLCKIVFDNVDCPSELEDIGKEIARNCKGLPLSIVVIGGLLTKTKLTREYWESTLENLSSIINLENDEHCLRILGTSYKALPIHLKPCFLYMGIFPEGHEIHVSDLIKLLVAEGILRPIGDKRLEEVAKEYVNELIDRNLIMVHKWRWNGEAKLCKIHDLLRDICIRKAQNQRFLRVLRQLDLDTLCSINMDRRIASHTSIKKGFHPQFLHSLESQSASLFTRSLFLWGFHEPSVSPSLRLLRVYKYPHGLTTDSSVVYQQANLRYISTSTNNYSLPFTQSLLWNLKTLEFAIALNWKSYMAPPEIWEMPLLRHLMLEGLQLPDPPLERQDFTLENLQTLSRITNFICSEEVIKRIPNIMTLKLIYNKAILDEEEVLPNLHLQNVGRLKRLESFNLDLSSTGIVGWKLMHSITSPHFSRKMYLRLNLIQDITFPHSLRKLSLRHTMLSWEGLTTRIGLLPLLEFLRLDYNACHGAEWVTVEGLFCSLRILHINSCYGLKYWETDDSHFPRLEHLILEDLPLLKEIPSSIGDIPTLKSIQLEGSSRYAAAESAKRIEEEQRDVGNDDLQVIFGRDSLF